MNIRQLIEALALFPDDTMIVQSKDEEGNSYSPLAEVSYGMYVPTTTWSGEFFDAEGIPDEGAVPAICLWPTN